MRNTMVDVLNEDFIKLKRAEGLSTLRVLYLHAARNSLLPVLHYGSVAIGFALGGSIVIEVVFSWPGLGRLLWTAVSSRDFPLAQGGFLMIATITIVANFVIDLVSIYVDTRNANTR
jgi:peptide/nickel transport system permease protein